MYVRERESESECIYVYSLCRYIAADSSSVAPNASRVSSTCKESRSVD